MITTNFLLLAGFAFLTLFIAVIKDKPAYALGSGAILLVLSMMVLSSGIQVETGVDINKTDVDSNTTHIDKQYQYTSLEEDVGINNTRNFMFLMIFAIALALIYNGLTGHLKG